MKHSETAIRFLKQIAQSSEASDFKSGGFIDTEAPLPRDVPLKVVREIAGNYGDSPKISESVKHPPCSVRDGPQPQRLNGRWHSGHLFNPSAKSFSGEGRVGGGADYACLRLSSPSFTGWMELEGKQTGPITGAGCPRNSRPKMTLSSPAAGFGCKN